MDLKSIVLKQKNEILFNVSLSFRMLLKSKYILIESTLWSNRRGIPLL